MAFRMGAIRRGRAALLAAALFCNAAASLHARPAFAQVTTHDTAAADGLFEEGRRLSYRLMNLKLRRAGQLRLAPLLRIELFLFWVVAGHGFRPLRVLGFSLASIIAYGLLFWITEGVVTPGETPRNAGFWECLYFSGITFSTVGYGDFLPAPHMRFVALTEGALGVFSIGFFVVILANRLRH